MTPSSTSLPAAPEPMHGCVRCGTKIPVSESMCEHCNPLGLKAPAASQAHGTVFLGIGLAVVGMAIVARFAIGGIGPFSSELTAVTPDPAGLRVAISVTNEGSSSGAVTCRIGDPLVRGITPTTAYVTSPQVEPGETRTFEALVTTLGTEPRELSLDCGR